MTSKQVLILRDAAQAVHRIRTVTNQLDGQGAAILNSAIAYLGTNQRKLAQRLDVSHTYLSKIACGHESMSPDLASRLSAVVEG